MGVARRLCRHPYALGSTALLIVVIVGGTLNVITVQTIALTDEITAIQIRGRRMAAAVLLVQALGGGWTAVELPSSADVMKRDDPAPRAP